MRTDRWGIDPGYEDCDRKWCDTPEDTRRAILEAMGVEGDPEPPVPHVKVVKSGRKSGLRGPGELQLEDGRTLGVDGEVPRDLPTGYHLFQKAGRRPYRLIVTPGRCYLPARIRLWGWAAQLYALRSAQSWGIGDLEDLRALAEWSAHELGAGLIMVNPLGAAAPGLPQQASPYYPCSRRFRNPIYLRIEERPELEHLAAAARSLNQRRLIDRERVFELKMQALAHLWERFDGDTRFEAYRREQGAPLRQFAVFCSLSEQFLSGWQCWPSAYRDPASPEVERFARDHESRVHFHEWVQWLIDVQLARCSEPLAIMQDLPVGVDPAGADAWAWQDVLASRFSFGAPPDPFAASGQDWGLPPFIPHKLRAAGYEPFVQTIRAAMRHAAALRLDHAMGLFRLFWIPRGASAAQGAYVRYPADDLLGIIALESHRAKAIVVGEDLGTVEDGVREKLLAHNVFLSRVLWFESDAPSRYPRQSMASLTTHDLPTVAGVWTGFDLQAQKNAGLNPNVESIERMREHLCELTSLRDGAKPREVIARAYEMLGQAPSMLITASLEDAQAVEERPNMPSTLDRWPNWSLALPKTLEELKADSLPRTIAAGLQSFSR